MFLKVMKILWIIQFLSFSDCSSVHSNLATALLQIHISSASVTPDRAGTEPDSTASRCPRQVDYKLF